MPEREFDLIAIGGGFAGLVAALRGAELGLRTAVLEQGSGERYLCSSRYAGGVFHVSYQDVKLPPAELEAAITKITAGEADPALAAAIAADAGRVVEWLAAQGAQFMAGSASSWHRFVLAPPRGPVAGPDWIGRGPDLLLARLGEGLRRHGGRIFFGTRARALRLEGGSCVGVTAEHARAAIDYAAAAVVIADGGFPADAELFRRHIGPRPDLVLQRHAGTARGDGLRMATAAGAAARGLDRFYGHLLCRAAMTDAGLWPYPQIDAVAVAGIVVDGDGRRLVDEGHGGIAIANVLARLDDPLCATVVCDMPIWESAGRAHQIPPNPLAEKAGGVVYRAASLDELARLARLSPSGLAATIAAYNMAIAEVALHRLSPTRSGLPRPIAAPPFLAIPICTAITNTMGGIAIDADARALRPDGSPIAGLYAAGGTTGGLEGGGPAVGYVGGLIKACLFGMRAAEQAASVAQ
jgi:fumarate reductase flavoprotein subunit